jgi:16S rRNA (cytosine1402-N4)-methyltransferase
VEDRAYHVPVLLQACLEGLAIKPNGTYVDVTFGGGGHSKAILSQLSEEGRLFAFDQDPQAKANADQFSEDRRFTLIPSNFSLLKKQLKFRGVDQVDGLLGDFGVSSHQLDETARGFSFKKDAPLDMRMNTNVGETAAEYLADVEEKELTRILRVYGELNHSWSIASTIVKARNVQPIKTTLGLVKVLEGKRKQSKDKKFFAKVFQAIRIAINGELEVIENLLSQTIEVVKPGGRLVCMSYHSLEDRLVKNFMKTGNVEGKVEKDFYGNLIRPFDPLQSKPITPEEQELEANPRSRSVRLRIAERRVERN